jgi:hypothetical protein
MFIRSFNGTDLKSAYYLPSNEKRQCDNAQWISKQFEKIGPN